MALPVTISFTVPALPEADIWFASNVAWAEYWEAVTATAELDGAVNDIYVPSLFDNTKPVYNFNVDGVDMVVVSKAMFDSLKDQVSVLDASYQNLRTQLKAAGFITQAQ